MARVKESFPLRLKAVFAYLFNMRNMHGCVMRCEYCGSMNIEPLPQYDEKKESKNTDVYDIEYDCASVCHHCGAVVYEHQFWKKNNN